MDIIALLKEAIAQRKPIEFEYVREDEPQGKRTGNPHILFVPLSSRKTMIHIFQTGGVSKSGLDNSLPWCMFDINLIESLMILDDSPSFKIEETYNPDWPIYDEIIAKV